MWAGIKLDDFEQNIYRNFYSEQDIELIKGIEDATLPQVRKLINKAYKIGDYYVAGLLEDMYDELLRKPRTEYPPLPPREELYAQYLQLMESGLKKLTSRYSHNIERRSS